MLGNDREFKLLNLCGVLFGGNENIVNLDGGGGIPVELFQILKDDAVKVLHSICQKIWKTQPWPQDWKMSFQSQRKAMPRMLKLLHNCIHLTR